MGVDPVEYANKLRTERFHLIGGNGEKEIEGKFEAFNIAEAAAVYHKCTWWAITDWNTGTTTAWDAADDELTEEG